MPDGQGAAVGSAGTSDTLASISSFLVGSPIGTLDRLPQSRLAQQVSNSVASATTTAASLASSAPTSSLLGSGQAFADPMAVWEKAAGRGGRADVFSSSRFGSSSSTSAALPPLWNPTDFGSSLPASFQTMLRQDVRPYVDDGSGAARQAAFESFASQPLGPRATAGRADLSQTFALPASAAQAGLGPSSPSAQVASVEFNTGGQVTRLTEADPDGAGPQAAPVTQYAYDTDGNLQQMTLPDGSTRLWDYNTEGQVTGYTDELGRQTLFELDASGNVLTARQVVGQVDSTANGQTDDCVTTFTYTTGSANPADPPAGLLATETDPLGHVTSYQYSARGLVTQITYAVGTADEAHVHVEYDAAWRISAQVDELGRRTEYGYDSSNRVTTLTQPDPDGPSGPLSAPVTS